MYEYKPTIKQEDFEDPQESPEKPPSIDIFVARSTKDRSATNQSDVQFCSVVKLWLETPGKKGPEDQAVNIPHEAIPEDAPNRWHFAPKEETVKIGWELKGRAASDGQTLANAIELKLELFTRNDARPLWTKTMKWTAGECKKRGETEFNGLLGEDQFKTAAGKTKPTDTVTIKFPVNPKFPDGVLTVDQSPYKLKLSIVDGGENRLQVAKWIYIDVLVDSLEMNWGDIATLPRRTDIADPKNLEKVCGHKKKASDPNDKDIKGYEEIILDELKAANPKPAAGVTHEVKLTSNLYAFQEKGKDNEESFSKNTDFTTYKALWGNGARIPLVVKAFIKKSVDGQKTDKVPEVLGNSKILWDWNEKKADRWKEALSAGKAPKTEPFLDAGYKKNNDAKPVALSNCPKEFGGKRGDDTKAGSVFPEHPFGVGFPFAVKERAVRKWASLSSFGTGENRDKSGAIFQPSRMAGDAYLIKAYLHFDRDPDSEDDITAPKPIQTEEFLFKVFRRINLHSLVRGRAKLNADPATLETNLKTHYLKELDMVVEAKQTDVDNTHYKAALLKALDRICGREHFVSEVKDIPYLSLIARYAVEKNPPADSAGIVFRSWDDISRELEQKFKTSRIRTVDSLSNIGAFLDEDITGKTSGAKGTLWKVNLRRYVLYSAGTPFSLAEQVEGESSQTVGNLSLAQHARSSWGKDVKHLPSTKKDEKIYGDSIKVVFPDTAEVVVKYKKLGITKGFDLSTDLTDRAKEDLSAAFYKAWRAHNEDTSFDIVFYGRDDSTNAKQRAQKMKTYLESFFEKDTVVDRQAVWEEVKTKLKTAFIGTGLQKNQKMLALLLVGEIAWEYAAQQFPAEEGIFTLHIPGLYEGYTFADAAAATSTATKMPKVMGASFPELTGDGNNKAFNHRHRSIVYMATVADGVADTSTPTKTVPSIFKHELAHSLFLPHSPARPSKRFPTPYPQCHVKEDKCLMNYDLDTEHFCGMCMMRLRGWNWQATALENRITAIQILDGDEHTYLTANAVQHVNLPVADNWVDGVNVMNKDRLGRKIKVKVEFQQELAGQNVYVQLLAHQNNTVYSPTEKAAKASYNFTATPAAVALGSFDKDLGAPVTGQTDSEGNFYHTFDLPAAAGNQFKLYAEDDAGNRVTSFEITTWRTFYYMILRYGHANSVGTPQIRQTIDATFLHNFTKWIFAGEVGNPSNQSYVSDNPTHGATTTRVRNLTNVACANLAGKTYNELDPYLARIVLVDMCMTPRSITTTPAAALVGTGSPLARHEIRAQADTNVNGVFFDLRKGLYHNQGVNESLQVGKPLNPATPANQYFIKGEVILHRQTVIAQVINRITGAGNARVTITAAGMNNSPKNISVPVVVGDRENGVADKIRAKLALDADITALFTIGGEYEQIVLTKKAAGAHDATLNVAINNDTCAGLTPAPTAINTAAGANSAFDGKVKGISIPVDFAAITPIVADAVNRPGGYIEVDVRVDNLVLNGAPVPQQNAHISLEVYVFQKCVAGMARLSDPRANGIIIMPAANNFKLITPGGQLNAIIHELGHCMGMNANPKEVQVDPHQYHYNHNGDHCSSGLPRTVANDGPSYQILANQDLPGLCVIFGLTSQVNPRTLFCADCERVMKKIDSSAGLLSG